MKKPQLEQLVEKANNLAVNLKILCRKPKRSEKQYRATIGYLQKLFSNLEIRFYTDNEGICPDLPLRGRIVGTARGNQSMFFHFVKQKNQYQKLAIREDTTPDGKTYIGLYSVLWGTAAKDETYLSDCKDYYDELIQQMGK